MNRSYDTLVQDILEVDVLKEYILDEQAKGMYVNLICSDWKEKLKNYVVYQQHVNRSDESLFQKINRKDNCESQFVKSNSQLNLMLALPCRVCINYENSNSKSTFSLYSKDSEPIIMVAQAMTRDQSKTHKVLDECKIYSTNCDILICNSCMDQRDKFRKEDIKVEGASPCIDNTKVFDGKDLVPRFATQIQSAFQSREFIAIVQIQVNMRAMFYRQSENSLVTRIGARLVKMVAFDLSKLNINDESPNAGAARFLPEQSCETNTKKILMDVEPYCNQDVQTRQEGTKKILMDVEPYCNQDYLIKNVAAKKILMDVEPYCNQDGPTKEEVTKKILMDVEPYEEFKDCSSLKRSREDDTFTTTQGEGVIIEAIPDSFAAPKDCKRKKLSIDVEVDSLEM